MAIDNENKLLDMKALMWEILYQWWTEKREDHDLNFDFEKKNWHDLNPEEKEKFRGLVGRGDITWVLFRKVKEIRAVIDESALLVFLADSLFDSGRMARRHLGPIPMAYLAGLSDSRDGSFSNSTNGVDRLMLVDVLSFIICQAKDESTIAESKQAPIPIPLDDKSLSELTEGSSFNRFVLNKKDRILNLSEGGASADRGTNISAEIVKNLSDLREEFLNIFNKNILPNAKRHAQQSEENPVGVTKLRKSTVIFEATGANDIVTVNNEATYEVVERAISARIENIKKLYEEGFEKFILGTLPDLSLTPEIQAQSAAEQEHYYRISVYFNQRLREEVAKVASDKENYPSLKYLQLYDINAPFMDAYVNGQRKESDEPGDYALLNGNDERPSYDLWRQARLDRTDLLDQEIRKLLGLSRREFNVFLNAGIQDHLHNHLKEKTLEEQSKASEFSVALIDSIVAIKSKFSENKAQVVPAIMNEREEGSKHAGKKHLVYSEWVEKNRRIAEYKAQIKVLEKLALRLQRIQDQEELVLFSKLKDLLERRARAYFYNGLHPSSQIYSRIGRDMVNVFLRQDRSLNQSAVSVKGQSDQRMDCLTEVRFKDALKELKSVDALDLAPKKKELVSNLRQSVEDIHQQSSGEVQTFVLASFMKDYADWVKKDFSSFGAMERSSRLQLDDSHDGSDFSTPLAKVFYHALFNGGGRSRRVLQRLGYLTKFDCKIPLDLSDEVGLAVSEAVDQACQRAAKRYKTIRENQKRQARSSVVIRSRDKEAFLRRFEALNGSKNRFSRRVKIAKLYYMTDNPALKRFMKIHPAFFEDSPSVNASDSLLKRMEQVAYRGGQEGSELAAKWAQLILKAGMMSDSTNRRRHIMKKIGVDGKPSLQEVAFKDRLGFNYHSKGEGKKNTLYDQLIRLLPPSQEP